MGQGGPEKLSFMTWPGDLHQDHQRMANLRDSTRGMTNGHPRLSYLLVL